MQVCCQLLWTGEPATLSDEQLEIIEEKFENYG